MDRKKYCFIAIIVSYSIITYVLWFYESKLSQASRTKLISKGDAKFHRRGCYSKKEIFMCFVANIILNLSVLLAVFLIIKHIWIKTFFKPYFLQAINQTQTSGTTEFAQLPQNRLKNSSPDVLPCMYLLTLGGVSVSLIRWLAY